MRRRLFQRSLLAALGAVTALLWPVSRDTLIPFVDSNHKWGYLNASGRVLIEPVWEAIGSPDH